MDKSSATLSPEKIESEGKTAYRNADYLAAAKTFAVAEDGYRLRGDKLQAAEMANNRSVALLQAGEHQSALNAVEGTIEIFRDAGDELHRAMALGNRAAAFEALSRLDEASLDYEEAADLLKAVGADEMRLDVLKSLSAIQMRKGQAMQALWSMQSGVDGMKRPTLKQRILKKILKLPHRLLK